MRGALDHTPDSRDPSLRGERVDAYQRAAKLGLQKATPRKKKTFVEEWRKEREELERHHFLLGNAVSGSNKKSTRFPSLALELGRETMPLSITDTAAVERAARAVSQLDSKMGDLRKEKVELTSRIKMNRQKLLELEALWSIMEARQKATCADLAQTEDDEAALKNLQKDFLVEERALVTTCKDSSVRASMASKKTSTSFAVLEKTALRGYSSGQGTTCTRAEARERERIARAMRSMLVATNR